MVGYVINYASINFLGKYWVTIDSTVEAFWGLWLHSWRANIIFHFILVCLQRSKIFLSQRQSQNLYCPKQWPFQKWLSSNTGVSIRQTCKTDHTRPNMLTFRQFSNNPNKFGRGGSFWRLNLGRMILKFKESHWKYYDWAKEKVISICL